MPTIKAAYDATAALFKEAWEGNPQSYDKPILWGKTAGGAAPKDASAWAQYWFQPNDGGQETLADEQGQARWKRMGLVSVQIFVPMGEETTTGLELVEIAMAAYEGQRTSNGVWFRNFSYTDVGPDGDWYQLNVTGEFEYSQLR